ncbi:unnamed protein product [Linum trigynum]|uniref:Uncharacterized protein n=1 Tax=Linum trigynum TaxID=586398 RepID=A0AAV2GT67_9ROSI
MKTVAKEWPDQKLDQAMTRTGRVTWLAKRKTRAGGREQQVWTRKRVYVPLGPARKLHGIKEIQNHQQPNKEAELSSKRVVEPGKEDQLHW